MEENGKLVSFIYADREVITEEDEAGEHIRYIRGHELLTTDSAHARTYYHYACDEMGSITDITDCDGTVLNHYAYDAFGNRTVEEETVENRFGFAGEILDAVTGQYYLRARFYNPVIARFLSEDTYYGDGLNLYAYCHNNPVGYVDPSGHICEKKYQELKKKVDEGGTLSDKEKKQVYEYEQNKNIGTSILPPDDLIVRDFAFLNSEGKIEWEKWAPNGGRVAGTIKENQTIPTGTIIDRYGSEYGKYTSPEGVPYEKRALPYIENQNAYHKYKVLKQIDNVTISKIAPAFNEIGGGLQYELPNSIKELKSKKYIEEIK